MISCSPFSFKRVSSEVEYWPDFVFLGFLTKFIFSNNTSPNCLGEDILKFVPEILKILADFFFNKSFNSIEYLFNS